MPDPADATPSTTNGHGETSLTLLERLRANEPEAWRVMVHLYNPLILQWCVRAGIRGADADDVSQDILRAVAARMEGFRRDRPGDSFRAWLRTIARANIADHFRRRGRQPAGLGGSDGHRMIEGVAAPDEDVPEEPGEVDGLHRRALDLVRAEFEERTWQMFWLTFIEERAPVDVAAGLGVTPAAVRKAKSRVLHRLKEEFMDLIQ
jgi:RNA polymerase sigma-70 factor (ECF subfamily)